MRFYKNLLTLGLGLLTAWGTPIVPASENKARAIENQPTTDVLDKRAVPPTVNVVLWGGLGKGTETHPTYVATLNTAFSGPPSHNELIEYAEKGFESMMAQKHPKKNTHLMAALFIPSTKSIYLSSVPDGPGIKKIRSTGAANAPAWWSQVKARDPLVFHAEDGAAYRYENSLTTKLKPGNMYPAGSFIAVYGIVENKAPQHVPLCAGGGKRPLNVPCSTVFRHLDVGF
ncbi:hypothetical protein F4680DRAFT_297976 [Xylaria scruposa]|nr:hypothetical protein F4680DRAFT_297976 [Xylaria scruposa]